MSGDINVTVGNVGMPFVFLISTFFSTCQINLNTVICPPHLVYLHNPSSKAEFLQRREEHGIKDRIVVIKATAFPVDLRRDLNAPCLHSLWGGAGHINDSPFLSDFLPKAIALRSWARWASGPELLHTTLYFLTNTHFKVFDLLHLQFGHWQFDC